MNTENQYLMWVGLVLISGFSLTGCGSTMVMTRGDRPSVNAPVNESKGGIVKYMTNSFAGQRRDRESAYKRMHKYCDGPYRITNEGPYSNGQQVMTTVPTSYGSATFPSSQNYIYISFECEPEVKP